MTWRALPIWVAAAAGLSAQSGLYPLESVTLEGSAASRSAVLAIAELRIGMPIDKAGIEAAAGKLQASGVFASICYRYAPSGNG